MAGRRGLRSHFVGAFGRELARATLVPGEASIRYRLTGLGRLRSSAHPHTRRQACLHPSGAGHHRHARSSRCQCNGDGFVAAGLNDPEPRHLPEDALSSQGTGPSSHGGGVMRS